MIKIYENFKNLNHHVPIKNIFINTLLVYTRFDDQLDI